MHRTTTLRACIWTMSAVVWIACSAAPKQRPPPVGTVAVPATSVSAPQGAHDKPISCATDATCAPGFCDRGVCAMPGRGAYGRECEGPEDYVSSLPPPAPGEVRGPKAGFPEPFCYGYRCIDFRCRSCQSDAECQGGSTCGQAKGWPGKQCGDYSHPETELKPSDFPPLPPSPWPLPPGPPGAQMPVPSGSPIPVAPPP